MHKKILLVAVSLYALYLAYCMFQTPVIQPTGTVIILNGPSGSGKSSIQKAFQALMMTNLWIKLGVDNLFDNPMPEIIPDNLSFWQTANPIRWVTSTQDADNKPVITLFVGKEGKQVAFGMNSAIAAYAQAGCNCIVDYIAYDQAWADDLAAKLRSTKTYWVKVTLPLEKLEEREKARGTSPVGHARSHYTTVHGTRLYDLVLDTSLLSPQECAQKIKELIEHT